MVYDFDASRNTPKGIPYRIPAARLRQMFPNFDAAFGGRVSYSFDCGSGTFCELDNGFTVGGIIVHGDLLQAAIGLTEGQDLRLDLPVAERTPATADINSILMGRKFRGFIGYDGSTDMAIDFGRFALLFLCERHASGLVPGVCGPAT